ncbi:hypothetical protein QBE55_10805 [Eubacteriales bacterium mix99]|jgi:hypothetical protein|nr:hypothetical protein [Clostridiales bacterium]
MGYGFGTEGRDGRGFFGGADDSLLFFFLLLIIIFCNCEFFDNGSELLFFFLILVFLFGGAFIGGPGGCATAE